MTDIHTALHLRVRFGETDQMGIAHHSAYVLWFEAARVEWLRDRGMSYREWEEAGVSLAVSEVSIRYRVAACFDDELLVGASLLEAKSRRVRFAYSLRRASDNVALATAETLHTPTNRQGRAIRLPAEWLEAISQFLES